MTVWTAGSSADLSMGNYQPGQNYESENIIWDEPLNAITTQYHTSCGCKTTQAHRVCTDVVFLTSLTEYRLASSPSLGTARHVAIEG